MFEAIYAMRRDFKAGDDVRDAGLTTPPDIERLDDICYGADPATQSLDVYRPRGTAGTPLPAIVSVHGGGWVYGDKKRYQYYCMGLAQRGFAVVNFTYRLAPEAAFPAPVEDTNAVFTWVLEHADELALDASRIFAVGDSAGAHLLCMYACILTNPAYAARFPFAAPQGLELRGVGLNCGVYDLTPESDPKLGALTTELKQCFFPEHGSAAEVDTFELASKVTPEFPPAFVMTAVHDMVRDRSPRLVAALQEAGVEFQYRFYRDPERKLGHVFHCDVRSPHAALCNDETCAFFRTLM